MVNGKTVNLDSPSKAASLGIGMVHQHFMLVEAFTVAENIILGSETTKHGVLDLKKASQDILDLSKNMAWQWIQMLKWRIFPLVRSNVWKS